MNKKEKPAAGSGFGEKVRFSLVLKLNLRMLGMLLSVFISLNLLLCKLLFGITLWQAEAGAEKIIAAYENRVELLAESTATPAVAAAGYEILFADRLDKGLRLPAFIQSLL